ncbi:hypothetical protein AQ505_11485 [Pedobacter sp. PACM 27299]|uniref:hypothetical protein n=1 Tax=Pedobacter sp. PACM 27299 TaxID=1727164 RepID=UPI00070588CB|nr:hypothetical protein [Pedobacter sp. PACM 27299]ALL06059.1 hypothetical protein AQ505_11485 [Pedobacter sp. PACM 27299]
MPTIYLSTFILATPAIVFDLSRSIDLHQVSTKQTQERVIAGRISPLGILGKIADHLFLKKYMETLLMNRNLTIKQHAESTGQNIS